MLPLLLLFCYVAYVGAAAADDDDDSLSLPHARPPALSVIVCAHACNTLTRLHDILRTVQVHRFLRTQNAHNTKVQGGGGEGGERKWATEGGGGRWRSSGQ